MPNTIINNWQTIRFVLIRQLHEFNNINTKTKIYQKATIAHKFYHMNKKWTYTTFVYAWSKLFERFTKIAIYLGNHFLNCQLQVIHIARYSWNEEIVVDVLINKADVSIILIWCKFWKYFDFITHMFSMQIVWCVEKVVVDVFESI